MLACANAAGAAIAAVDNLASAGEVSPIVIVVLLLTMALVAGGAAGGRRGVAAALIAAAWVPGVHLVKKVLAVTDTLQPGTYGSIAKLAALVVVVSAVGAAAGMGLRRTLGARAAG